MSPKETPLKLKERKLIIECIQLYRRLPPLWNVKCKDYRNRHRKNQAYDILLDKYRQLYPEATIDDVKKKFNSLRTNYRKELKKYLESKKFRPDGEYKSNSWYFDELNFLQDQEILAQDSLDLDEIESEKVHDEDNQPYSPQYETEYLAMDDNYKEDSTNDEDSEIQDRFFNSSSISSTSRNPTKRKEINNLIEIAAKKYKDKDKPDEYENWALAIAADLRKMKPTQQIFAKQAIANIIMEGQLDQLHRHSVKINEFS